mmetsp:Transcript_115505/g.326504  ORF Transcript_115505/g.326504 Transcript_115505/m.326504 type:complete len:483 (-) Transcript_115505:41-1489(-)
MGIEERRNGSPAPTSVFVIEQLKQMASETAAEAITQADEFVVGGGIRSRRSSRGTLFTEGGQRRGSVVADERAVERLSDLGFSFVAVRYALSKCRGRVEDAGAWLIQDVHSEEILAVEAAAREAFPLAAGHVVRITGLRGARHLNGVKATLMEWDADAERWTVQLLDGTTRNIRPRNLDQEGFAALSLEELSKAIAAEPHLKTGSTVSPARRPPSECLAEGSEVLASTESAAATVVHGGIGDSSNAGATLDAPGEHAELRRQVQSADQGASHATQEIKAVEQESSIGDGPQAAERQRAEFEQVQPRALDEALESARRQEEARRLVDERERRLLEAEEEQLRFGEHLRTEMESLERERRKVALLQRSLLANASMAVGTPTATSGGRLEVTLDDGALVDAAASEGASDEDNVDTGDKEGVWDIDWCTLTPAGADANEASPSDAMVQAPELPPGAAVIPNAGIATTAGRPFSPPSRCAPGEARSD